MKRLGLDVGSTTLKCALLDEEDRLIFSAYERHYSKITETMLDMLSRIDAAYPGEVISITLSGSAGMGLADALAVPFVQEVYAERLAVKALCPDTDAVIELGGEDAKILFLRGGFEMRMNGTCAGGTGAFIDQMASLMQVTPDDINDLAARHEKVYTIASRCGVFAKSDIQPLLNQGARKEDISAGIFHAVVNQTIGGLAQGRQIGGSVLYLGGPLTFLPELRRTFDEVLNVTGKCPENSLYFVAIGAACAGVGREESTLSFGKRLRDKPAAGSFRSARPLFCSEAEYDAFVKRHEAASDGTTELAAPKDRMYLGVDAGSTTVKAVLCDKDGNIFRPFYTGNNGNPVPLIRKYLEDIYRDFPDIKIISSAATGYGEEIIKNAFGLDFGIVETVAHYTAAKFFKSDVDFILDIGGQDIKCFQIRGGAIDNLYLNEACSSGCGSFLQTFAGALGYDAGEFAKLGRFAAHPVDLGSRCTVFMNSAVKQAQKDGASVEDIAAGLSVSVVKNALYKVIRCADPKTLGKNIIVQGGTFLNDCVLRAFEQEIGQDVIRPKYAPLMGAYGAALYAAAHEKRAKGQLVTAEDLAAFTHHVKAVTCNGCGNHCALTVNTFSGGRRFIAGNRCDRPLHTADENQRYDLYEYKLELLGRYCKNRRDPAKKTVGLPLGLNFYELLPFWYAFFDTLGFNVVVSPVSDRGLYLDGQHTIPSDTACYPAKLMHGHIEALLREAPDAIFYPGMTYNVNEKMGQNHFNCPVVAYYPQVLKGNVRALEDTIFISDFVSPARRRFFEKRIRDILAQYFPVFSKREIRRATAAAYDEYEKYFSAVRQKASGFIDVARREGREIIVLAGRPYHVDPEINHGIHTLICKLGAVVLTEDSISHLVQPFRVKVRNQWTYHARLYAAAKYVADAPPTDKMSLVQLVSFGCGVDAVTTDEVRRIIEEKGGIYTQLKIDEISNIGAVNIRLRSLFAALKDKERGS